MSFIFSLPIFSIAVTGQLGAVQLQPIHYRNQEVYRTSHALLIADESETGLASFGASIRKLREALVYKAGFPRGNIITLDGKLATLPNIRRAMTQFKSKSRITSRDRVVIAIALHGTVVDGTAYFRPAGTRPSASKTKLVPMRALRSFALKEIAAKHVLLLSDSCYSGFLTGGKPLLSRPTAGVPLQELFQRSFKAIWTGADEQDRTTTNEADQSSPLIDKVADLLGSDDAYADGILRDSELFFGARDHIAVNDVAVRGGSMLFAVHPEGYVTESQRQADLAATALLAAQRSERVNDLELRFRNLPLDAPRVQRGKLLVELSDAYIGLTSGDRRSTVQTAIAKAEAAIPLLSEVLEPDAWATAHNCLGMALRDLPAGDLTLNREQAIQAFEKALRCLERNPKIANVRIKRASTMNNIAVSLTELSSHNRESNLNRAIELYSECLTVYTKDAHFARWAETKCNLASAYSRLEVNRLANQERAISCYDEVIEAASPKNKTQFELWALAKLNRGRTIVSRRLIQGKLSLDSAVRDAKDALRFYTLARYPESWISAQQVLGNAYSSYPNVSETQRLDAIEHYSAARREAKLRALSNLAAEASIGLGATYEEMGKHKEAIEAYDEALSYYDSDKLRTENWGVANFLLGNLYARRGQEGDLQRAELNYKASLTYFDQLENAQLYCQAAVNLSWVLINLKKVDDARGWLERALKVGKDAKLKAEEEAAAKLLETIPRKGR